LLLVNPALTLEFPAGRTTTRLKFLINYFSAKTVKIYLLLGRERAAWPAWSVVFSASLPLQAQILLVSSSIMQ